LTESDLFDDNTYWNWFTSEDTGDYYWFSELSEPVIDMFSEEGMERQVRHVVREIQKVIDLFDNEKKYQIQMDTSSRLPRGTLRGH